MGQVEVSFNSSGTNANTVPPIKTRWNKAAIVVTSTVVTAAVLAIAAGSNHVPSGQAIVDRTPDYANDYVCTQKTTGIVNRIPKSEAEALANNTDIPGAAAVYCASPAATPVKEILICARDDAGRIRRIEVTQEGNWSGKTPNTVMDLIRSGFNCGLEKPRGP